MNLPSVNYDLIRLANNRHVTVFHTCQVAKHFNLTVSYMSTSSSVES